MQKERLVEHEGQRQRPQQSEILSLGYRNGRTGSV
jgi:hypothetical protein